MRSKEISKALKVSPEQVRKQQKNRRQHGKSQATVKDMQIKPNSKQQTTPIASKHFRHNRYSLKSYCHHKQSKTDCYANVWH
jgi:hypothetical protein